MSSFQQNNYKAYKETQTMAPSKEENKSTETIPEKDLIATLLDKNFKTTTLRILKY